MLNYNEIKERKYIIYDDEPYEVLSSHVFRKQQRKPVNATKLRNLLTGRVVEVSFQVSDKVHEADMGKKPLIFIYESKGQFWFHPEGKPSERFTLEADQVGPASRWLIPNAPVDVIIFTDDNDDQKIIGLSLPVKMDFLVTSAPPAIKGNTATGGTKQVILETGTQVNVPLFINEGDRVRINTETGDYVERAEKN